MNEEVKNENKEQTCFCKSELVQRTIAVTIGSFIGVYLALSLFCATHKPPTMMFHHHEFGKMPMQQRIMHEKFRKPHDFRPDFDASRENFQKNKPEKPED